MHKGRSLKGPKAPRGQAPKLITGRHHLFHGELSDAPGVTNLGTTFFVTRRITGGSLSQKGLTSPVLLSLRRPKTR